MWRRVKMSGLAILAAMLLQGCAILAPDNRRLNEVIDQVRQGMSREQVLALLGPPDETIAFARTRTLAWDYRYIDSWGQFALYSVIFGPDGRVQSTLTQPRGDGRDKDG